MAITEFGGGGGHTYTDVRVAVRGGTRPGELCAGGRRLCAGILASNADCFHSSGVVAGPRLTRVELSSTFDDYRASPCPCPLSYACCPLSARDSSL